MTEQLSTGKAVLPGWVLVSIVQSCLTLCNPMDWTVVLQAFLSMGILQARILECIAVPFSRESSWPRGWTQVSCIAGKSFTSWATREAPCGEGYTNTNPANKVISENAMKRFTGWSMIGLRARFFSKEVGRALVRRPHWSSVQMNEKASFKNCRRGGGSGCRGSILGRWRNE